MKASDQKTVAEALDINSIISKAARQFERSAKLSPVFLRRNSFAASATSTGSLWIDYITGGGIPPGRIVGVSGPEHSGKSLILTEIAANQLRAGRAACYMDAEGGNDPLFLKSRGIDFDIYRGARNKNGELKPKQQDLIYYYQPETGDQMLNYMHGVMSALPENRNAAHPPIIFFLDSVVALISDAVGENIDANKMAMHAKMYAEMLPIIQSHLSRTGCSWVYSNQLRKAPMVTFGSPDYEPCGDALKFFSAIRMRLGYSKPKVLVDKDHPFLDFGTPRQNHVWEEQHVTGGGELKETMDRAIYTSVRTIKNKVFNPQKVCWMKIYFEEDGQTGSGLDKAFDSFSFLMETGYLEKGDKGAFSAVKRDIDLHSLIGLPNKFNYTDYRIFAKNTPDLTEKLRQALIMTDAVYTQDGVEVDSVADGENA
jgi:RecA/RadA recombinase